jgi:hypothetical protein
MAEGDCGLISLSEWPEIFSLAERYIEICCSAQDLIQKATINNCLLLAFARLLTELQRVFGEMQNQPYRCSPLQCKELNKVQNKRIRN